MQTAPGYYSDAREMDAQAGASVRRELASARDADRGPVWNSALWIRSALHGDLGESRQFHSPVSKLIAERAGTSLRLLCTGLLGGWAAACAIALLLSIVRSRHLEVFCLLPASWLLVLPVGALSMVCFLTDWGGPGCVLIVVVAARELHYLHRMLFTTIQAPHFTYLRALGVRTPRLLWACVLPQLAAQLLSLLLRSFLTAVGLLVPVEVLFDQPGLGQLAWSATMNRDLPVLLAITLLFAMAFSLAGAMADLNADRAHA